MTVAVAGPSTVATRWDRGAALGGVAFVVLDLVVAGALSLASATVSATLALHIDTIGDDLTTFHALGALLSTASGIGLAAHLLATNLLGGAQQRLPRWLVVAGVVSAVAWLVQAVAGATSTGGASSSIGLAAFLLWCTWILGISHHLWSESAPMWIARVDDDLYVRSAGGAERPWYRHAMASATGRICADGIEADVTFTQTPDAAQAAIDDSYHAKYDRYGAGVVGTVVGPEAHAVTIRLVPAQIEQEGNR